MEEDAEGGWTARAIGHSIFTQGETIQELKGNIRDAVTCHFGDKVPQIIHSRIVKEETMHYV